MRNKSKIPGVWLAHNARKVALELTLITLLAVIAAIVPMRRTGAANTQFVLATQSPTLTPVVSESPGAPSQAVAESGRLALLADKLLNDPNNPDPETAALLSIRALKTAYTAEADAQLVRALDNLFPRRPFTSTAGRQLCV